MLSKEVYGENEKGVFYFYLKPNFLSNPILFLPKQALF